MKRLLRKTNSGYVPVKPLNSYKEKQTFLYNLGLFAGKVEDLMEKHNVADLEHLEKILND